jgi:hypothetical protein
MQKPAVAPFAVLGSPAEQLQWNDNFLFRHFLFTRTNRPPL